MYAEFNTKVKLEAQSRAMYENKPKKKSKYRDLQTNIKKVVTPKNAYRDTGPQTQEQVYITSTKCI